ncbi:hypothetical protein DAPPUDRAFT_249347 [Daphnia pulex]|uniref:Uncharacterized protein n=1 Tax=Daphnia pulex TaxID=6669 RepID=E9GWH0_DAPPU|nr:hypothetical protein DAPPUDRAFT_249347 [Daphnia pulex]|eukprot:EFX76189.1 hypothetical protein DAPPUDRAFT_249347 [Daphnia pulex]
MVPSLGLPADPAVQPVTRPPEQWPGKVAHKVSDHSDAGRVVLWRKWAFHIA